MRAIGKPMGAAAWAMLLGLSVIWGGSFFFIKIALEGMAPFTLVLGRVAVGGLVLHALLRAMGQRMPTSPRLWADFTVMGLLGCLVPFSLISWGETEIASGLAAILNATTPIFAILIAHRYTTDERLTARRLAGVLIGFAGVIVMIGLEALRGLGPHLLAQLAVLAAAASYACAGVYGRRFHALHPLVPALGQVTTTALLMIPLVLYFDRPWLRPMPAWRSWGALLALGALSTGLAYVAYFRLLARAGATNLLLVTFLIPATALVLGIGVLGEPIELRQLAGMAIIGSGLAVIDGRPLAALARLSGQREIRGQLPHFRQEKTASSSRK